MALDFLTLAELWATMVYYLKGVMEDFPEVITVRSTILAENHMFQDRPEGERTLLDEGWATAFHYTVNTAAVFHVKGQ